MLSCCDMKRNGAFLKSFVGRAMRYGLAADYLEISR
jgi:hypothetical protein